ncbi:MAG: sigma-E factor negative regulatory protein [Halioglobus sp.]|nr:sigma-E factor negative regulatory protein [Halioglobus sp.]
MNDKLRESLSALMDDEANELEFERILANAGGNEELRETWTRYNLARQAADGQRVGLTGMDISRRVSAAIEQEEQGGEVEQNSSLGQRLLRPLVSFGVAASVATVVLVGGQQLAGVSTQDSSNIAASIPSAPSYINMPGANPVQARLGTEAVPIAQPAARALYRQLAEERMQQHMQEHAEHAALNTPHGLLPYARVPVIEKRDAKVATLPVARKIEE